MNPLFADEPEKPKQPNEDEGFVLKRPKEKHIHTDNPAAELIRRKIEALYSHEPDAREEIKEVAEKPQAVHRSKHQQFMHDLSQSGKPLAQIQQAWHDYYSQLPDQEKHEVWQEFYENSQQRPSAYTRAVQQQTVPAKHELPVIPKSYAGGGRHYQPPRPHAIVSEHAVPQHHRKGQGKRAAIAQAKHKLTKRLQSRTQAQTKANQHFKSLLVGLSFGGLAILIVLFGFFNEIVIARLIQPSGGSAETPIILNTNGVAPSKEPQVIIPKINVQLPMVLGVNSSSEDIIQDALDQGVIHYPGTSLPGQKGNAAIFGHSSNNIFNSGKYKFAFVLLKELVPGDIFYVTHKGVVYTYRVYDKRIVAPDETWVLGNAPGKLATAALITCDPPGTTINRLVVWGEQITPDPTKNSSAPTPNPTAPELPAQGPTLWGRFWNWITGDD